MLHLSRFTMISCSTVATSKSICYLDLMWGSTTKSSTFLSETVKVKSNFFFLVQFPSLAGNRSPECTLLVMYDKWIAAMLWLSNIKLYIITNLVKKCVELANAMSSQYLKKLSSNPGVKNTNIILLLLKRFTKNSSWA